MRRNSLLGEVGDSELNKVADVHSPDLQIYLNMFEEKSNCAISSSPFFISCFSCYVPLRQLFTFTVQENQMLWVLGTSSTATLFWTSCGRLGGQGLGVELAEELAEEFAEEELLCELGRERARNLTTDLFAYLRPSFQVSSNCNLSSGTDQHISTLPGGAHQHGVFPRRSKVDVLLQHQRRTSGCVPAGL